MQPLFKARAFISPGCGALSDTGGGENALCRRKGGVAPGVCAVGAAGLIEQLLRVILREGLAAGSDKIHALTEQGERILSCSALPCLYRGGDTVGVKRGLRRPVEQHCRALYASERAAGGTGLNIVHRIVEHDAESVSGLRGRSSIGCARRGFNCRGGSLGCGVGST